MAMAVAQDRMLNPINPNTAGMLLSKLAASDAKHDFKTPFIDIFGRFSNIGTSVEPNETFSEWQSFSNVFNNNTAIRSDSNYIFRGDADPGKAFRKNVLNPVFANGPGLTNISLATDLNADHKYKLQTKLFLDNERNMMTSVQLLDFLVGSTKNRVLIQQDASFISFGDFFISNSNAPGDGSKSFTYINSREGQNDAAGKTGSDSSVVKKTQTGKTVKVEVLEDVNVDNKKYPKYSTSKDSDIYQNFQSIYNITLSPIKITKGVKTVSLDFFNQSKINATQKGKAENAKSNLKSRLTAFLKNIIKKATNNNNDSYFTALQQKRSGDWLQVLSTYDISRYNIKGERIIIITHDSICAAYGIAMGADVLFTLQEGKQKWIAYFQNENYLTPPKNKYIIERYDHVKRNINGFIKDLDTNIKTYETQRKAIIDSQNTVITSIGALDIRGQTPKDFNDTTNIYYKDILEKYFKYSLLLSIFPENSVFQTKLDELKSQKQTKEKSLDKLPNDDNLIEATNLNIFREYENIANSLYNLKELLNEYSVPVGRGVPIISLSTIQGLRFASKSKDMQELQSFLQNFSPFNVEKLDQEKSKFLLNRFRLNNASEKKNDYGVFSVYLSRLPKASQDELYALFKTSKESFKASMDRLSAQIRNKDKIEKLNKQFDLFIKEIDIYFSSENKNPSFEIATTGELLNEINDIQKDDDDDDDGIIEILGGAKQKTKYVKQKGGDAEATDSIVINTPFTIYLIMLLQKRNTYYLNLNSISRELIGIGISVGLFYVRSSISNILSNVSFGIISPNVADIGAIIISIIPSAPIDTNLNRLQFVNEPYDISPLILRTDAFTTLSNDPYIRRMKHYENILSSMRSSTMGGGNLDSFDIAFQGWSSLFFHMDTLRRELDDISDPNNGFDFEYYARYTQFLISMEKSIDTSIDFFTKEKVSVGGRELQPLLLENDKEVLGLNMQKLLAMKSKKPKNLKLKTVALTTPLESKRAPVDIHIVSSSVEKELDIGYCSMFTCFGDYANLILTNLLPRIYFDEIWNESLPMLNKAFTGNPESLLKWPALISELCNDNYLNMSVDTNLNDFFKDDDYYLRYFLIATCYNLEQMPTIEPTKESMVALQKELSASINRLIKKINLVEKSILVFAYRKKANDETIQMSNISDLEFLMDKNLLNKNDEAPENTSKKGGSGRRSYKKTRRQAKKRISRLKSRRRT